MDERSIVDVQPDDLRGYSQCHFFAGIGGWSYAARLAGWPDSRLLWTGSCPCQPFSVAGKGEGQNDERHLWPVFFDLIRACRPDVVMGEQVAAAVGKDWLDGVSADLEGIGYACGATVVPACAVDAPHRRDRLWFVADAQVRARGIAGKLAETKADRIREVSREGAWIGALGNEGGARRGNVAHAYEPSASAQREQRSGKLSRTGSHPWACHSWLPGSDGKARRVGSNLRSVVDGLPESLDGLCADFYAEAAEEVGQYAKATERRSREVLRALRDQVAAQTVWQEPRGFFGIREAEILLPYLCELERRFDDGRVSSAVAKVARDGLRGLRVHDGSPCPSQRRGSDEQHAGEHPDALHVLSQLLARSARQAFEAVSGDAPPLRLLAHGVEARVGKLRALGNAIVPQVAAEVIAAYLDAELLEAAA
ncbi:DNA cytosine methyltransferase [Tianweitania sediminis]|uniref:DNA cytosine methyltransferase n=1 Tax=Tianweitania sediminis TaxID=1502156 RepID=UPI003611D541